MVNGIIVFHLCVNEKRCKIERCKIEQDETTEKERQYHFFHTDICSKHIEFAMTETQGFFLASWSSNPFVI